MITYELAIKLKDGGFPLIEANGSFGITVSQDETEYFEYPNLGDLWWKPTLSELIEACGEYITLTHVGPNWRAWKGAQSDCDGSTPSEAIANLWLELNKKDENTN